MTEIVLRLYISGVSPESNKVLARLHEICQTCEQRYRIEVVDVLQTPKQAEYDKVVATPTVIRVNPLPQRRVIGDLTDLDGAMMGLGLETAVDPSDFEEVGYANKN